MKPSVPGSKVATLSRGQKEYGMFKYLIARASINVKAPNELVWEALVNPDALLQYMFGTQVISD